jgi:hypothetical protein
MSEEAIIHVPIYRNRFGWHVCRLDNDHQCRFLGYRKFGQIPVCMFGENHDLSPYNGDDLAYTEPDCGLVQKEIKA